MTARCLLALALIALAPSLVPADWPAAAVARADGHDSHDDAATREAKRHFERGEKLYALAKFSAALDEYQKAYDAKSIPALLFNIGQCYRNLGDYDAAIFSYRKYLKAEPDAANREQVEQLISDLEAKKEQSDSARLGLLPPPTPAAQPQPAPAPPPPPPSHPFYTRWWFWTGVVLVAGAAGGVTYEATRPSGAPNTALGNIVFGK
jgi:tetratricopeptide (TPR) repeat protein